MQGKLEQYKIFKAVAETGNISSTAKELYISQSAVSQSLKNLEDSLGVRLFSRSSKGVTLTKDGDTLLSYVSNALSLIEAGERKLNETKELINGELVIGASNTLTDGYLLPFLQEYHTRYPKVKVKILNGTSKRVTDYLSKGIVDIAFATTNEAPNDFSCQVCFKTHTAFVASPTYPIDFNKEYTLSEISKLPLLLLEKEAGSRIFLENCFLKEGIKLEPEIELASYELLISLAKIGLGIAIITEEFSKEALDAGLVKKINVKHAFPERAVSLLTPKGTDLSMAAKKFLEGL